MKHIVILGGSYGGVSTAHRLLKLASKSTTTAPFKITLISPNTDFFWSMASPRALIPGQFNDSQLFRSIAAGFSQYTDEQFEFIVARAQSVDAKRKTVTISSDHDTNSELEEQTRVIAYDILVLATGARTRDGMPFKDLGSTEETREALRTMRDTVENAKMIVVAGAGVTGVEIAGELAFRYGGEKDIILLSSTSSILPDTPESVSALATKELQALNVTIKHQTKVLRTTDLPSRQTQLHLSTDETLLTNLYIPAFGLLPNSSYLPRHFLNAQGFVPVDQYLRVKSTDAENIWAIGDVSDHENAQFITCDRQSAHLAKNLIALLSNKTMLPYKVATRRLMGLQVGKNAGTGHWGNWRMPSFVIVWARQNLFTENLGRTVDGSLF